MRITILVMLLAVIATNLLTFAAVLHFASEDSPVYRIDGSRENPSGSGVISCRRLDAGKLACEFPAGFHPE